MVQQWACPEPSRERLAVGSQALPGCLIQVGVLSFVPCLTGGRSFRYTLESNRSKAA